VRYRAAAGVGEEAHSRGTAALVPMVETGECGDVGTRVWPHSDGTCLGRALKCGRVARQHENGFKYGAHHFAHSHTP